MKAHKCCTGFVRLRMRYVGLDSIDYATSCSCYESISFKFIINYTTAVRKPSGLVIFKKYETRKKLRLLRIQCFILNSVLTAS